MANPGDEVFMPELTNVHHEALTGLGIELDTKTSTTRNPKNRSTSIKMPKILSNSVSHNNDRGDQSSSFVVSTGKQDGSMGKVRCLKVLDVN